MSFEWNLSDDEGAENESLEDWSRRYGFVAGSSTNRTTYLPPSSWKNEEEEEDEEDYHDDRDASLAVGNHHNNDWNGDRPEVAKRRFLLSNDNDDDDDDADSGDDEEGLDWEEGGGGSSSVDGNDDDDRKPAAIVTRTDIKDGESNVDSNTRRLVPITVDLSNNNKNKKRDDKNKQQDRPRRKQHKLKLGLHPEIQDLVHNLSRTHLLTLLSRGVFLSSIAANETLHAILCSLYDSDFDKLWSSSQHQVHQSPSIAEVQDLLEWYTRWQQQREERIRCNQLAGAPTLASSGRQRKRQRRGNQSTTANMLSAVTDLLPMPTSEHLIRVSAYWSDPDPQLDCCNDNDKANSGKESSKFVVSETDRVLLFIAVARSLGYRTRLVQAMCPIPPLCHDASIDVHHPLFFMQYQQLAQLVLQGGSSRNTASHRKTKRARPTTENVKSESATAVTPDDGGRNGAYVANSCEHGPRSVVDKTTMLWVEILCHVDVPAQKTEKATNGRRAMIKRRWIHVDPLRQLVNRPDLVEALFDAHTKQQQQESALVSKTSGGSRSRTGHVCGRRQRMMEQAGSYRPNIVSVKTIPKGGLPAVPYVVAIEHASTQLFHVTDVTPRYAHNWVNCLMSRCGFVGGKSSTSKKHAQLALASSDRWWNTTLQNVNYETSTEGKNATSVADKRLPSTYGKCLANAIVLDDVEAADASARGKVQDAPIQDAPPTNAQHHVMFDATEAHELEQSTRNNEIMPTSKAGFTKHPLYVIPSVLGKTEVLDPNAKSRIRGLFKGECIYPRECVSTVRPALKWLYLGRKVRDEELKKPVKRNKARKKPISRTFQPLLSYGVGAGNDGSIEQQQLEIAKGTVALDDSENDGMQDLFAVWQTDPWSPTWVGPNDPIPIHPVHMNIELALLNPGLVHLDQRGLAPVAQQLGIPYAPCLVGFDGQGANRHPTIRGIVVHEHNAQLLREASVEVMDRAIHDEHEAHEQAIYHKWKRLMRGLLVKDRIEREYGDT